MSTRRACQPVGSRTVLRWTVMVSLATLASGCTSSVHTQDPTSSPTTSNSVVTTSTSISPTSPTTSPTWTPPAYGDARPAVDAYLAMLTAGNAAFRDPQHASDAPIDKYADGEIRYIYHQSLADARKQKLAYRGTPAMPRVTVVSLALNASLPKVVLRDCALSSANDPWTAYSLATGKPIPSAPNKVPPPYANTITAFKTQNVWHVFTIKTDGTRTCHP